MKKSNEEKKTGNDEEPTNDEEAEEIENCSQNSVGETEEGNSSNSDCDQDSEISFMTDTDEVIDTAEIEEEDWIEYMKRSTRFAEEKMRTANIPCWIIAHKKMKWRLAARIASQPQTRWSKKAAKWNPGLDSKLQEQWEDRIRDGKTTSINSSSLRKQKKLDAGSK